MAEESLPQMETILFDRLTILTLKSILFLARHNEEKRYFKVKEMAEALGVSRSYLARIIQGLVKNGILKSSTGPAGGFYLPDEKLDLTVDEVLSFTGYASAFNRCLMEWPGCNQEAPCPLHKNWAKFKEGVRRDFSEMTVRQARRLLYDGLKP